MKRLETVLSCLRKGCRIADIGCDHAYLPICAVQRGIAVSAYASDVRPGPLSHAEKNVEAASLSDRITLRLADGLDGADEFRPDTVIIAGMGGELIAGIIGREPYVRNMDVVLVLQPMTSAYELRSYLLSNGFGIDRERLAREGNRLYQIFTARYGFDSPRYSEAELEVGRDHEDRDLIPALYEKYIKKYERIIRGKNASHADVRRESAVLSELVRKYENERTLR